MERLEGKWISDNGNIVRILGIKDGFVQVVSQGLTSLVELSKFKKHFKEVA